MTELARLIATKAVSPVEVVRAHLDRIAALDRDLRAYITVRDDAALQAASAAEAAVMSGQPLGPLHGVPYALKISTTPPGCAPPAARASWALACR
jgi:aspartyl-tRNA(Asn)/glutamyl-tRNA(Gln) amidotransferase subunit A